MDVVNEGVRTVCVWIARLAYLNLLWLLFTLAGLVVAGFFPATMAGYQIARDWVYDPESRDRPLFRRFAGLFRAHLLRATMAGFVLVAIAVLLAGALRLAWTSSGQLWQLPAVGVAVIASVLFVGGLVHLPFIAAHLDAPLAARVRSAWLYALAHPLGTVVICAAWVGVSFGLGAFPAAALFFSFSPVALLTAVIDVRGFRRLEQRHTASTAV